MLGVLKLYMLLLLGPRAPSGPLKNEETEKQIELQMRRLANESEMDSFRNDLI